MTLPNTNLQMPISYPDENPTLLQRPAEQEQINQVNRITITEDEFRVNEGDTIGLMGRALRVTLIEPKVSHKRLAFKAIPQGKEKDLGATYEQLLCALCIESISEGGVAREIPMEFISRMRYFSPKEFDFITNTFISCFFLTEQSEVEAIRQAAVGAFSVPTDVCAFHKELSFSRTVFATFKRLSQADIIQIEKLYPGETADYTSDDLMMAASLQSLNGSEITTVNRTLVIDALNELCIGDYQALSVFFYNLNFMNSEEREKSTSLGKKLRDRVYNSRG